MIIKQITDCIEEIAPLSYAETFDNVGLLVGNYNTKVTKVLVTLDTLEKTVDEAIAKGCSLIVSFHPIIFNGLKKLNGNNYVEKVVLKAIKNDIAIYATHTALDNSKEGVSAKIAAVLGLTNTKILIPKKGILQQLTTYVPKKEATRLKQALFTANAGSIGNYDQCSFTVDGIGTFRANEDANPTLGKRNQLHTEEETKISVIFESKDQSSIIKKLQEHHPYEEIAYEITATQNEHPYIGMGIIGEFSEAMQEHNFLSYLKNTMQTACVRHSKLLNKKIKKVAVLGGSGSFAIEIAKKAGADAYISADFKYHDFFKAEQKILLADIGHYESEQFTKKLLIDYLTKKISNFAPAFEVGNIILSKESTNPIYYV